MVIIGSGITFQSGITIDGEITNNIITDNLFLHLDASNSESYPGSGTTWFDLTEPG